MDTSWPVLLLKYSIDEVLNNIVDFGKCDKYGDTLLWYMCPSLGTPKEYSSISNM